MPGLVVSEDGIDFSDYGGAGMPDSVDRASI